MSSAPSEVRGRVLRVKRGYNPNSSSVGSLVPLFLSGALAAGALTVVGVQLWAAFRRDEEGAARPTAEPGPAPATGGAGSPCRPPAPSAQELGDDHGERPS